MYTANGPGPDRQGFGVLHELQRNAVFEKTRAIVGLTELAARIGEGSRLDDFDGLDGS